MALTAQHPCPPTDSWQEQGTLHIVMEYCAGGTLHDRIIQKRDKGVPMPVVQFVVQIALAVQVVHRAGFIHRDLKAQNIFLDRHEHLKLGDFGPI